MSASSQPQPQPMPGIRAAAGDAAIDVRRSDVVYQGRLISVRRERVLLPNGHEADHELVTYPAAVSIIPVLEAAGGRPELVLIEQFRNSVKGFIHEIPAGMLAAGEDPLDCARRELEEETGYRAATWTHVATLLPTPGISGVLMHYYLAEGLAPTGRQALEPTECLQVKRVPIDDLLDSMVARRGSGRAPVIVDGKTHIAVFYLGARRGGAGRSA